MPANVAGQNLPRTGKAARRLFVEYKAKLNPTSQRYAEAYWRHKRREAVSEPTSSDYGLSPRHATAIEHAIESIIETKGLIG